MRGDMAEEGWYTDPFGEHQQRWFSAGSPTALVRDGNVEGHDPPPDRPVARPLVPVEPVTTGSRDYFKRADDAEGMSPNPAFRRADDAERVRRRPDQEDVVEGFVESAGTD